MTLFQQMSSKGLPLRLTELLPRVAQLLTECALAKENSTRSLQPALSELTE
jgi:hypothetical protein